MNREVWFRVLQVAVVAPWLYYISGQTKQKYFQVGLKLVAGSIIMMNIKPLYQDYLKAQELLAQLKTQVETTQANVPVLIEGESEPV